MVEQILRVVVSQRQRILPVDPDKKKRKEFG